MMMSREGWGLENDVSEIQTFSLLDFSLEVKPA
jgi:hypothetical protein